MNTRRAPVDGYGSADDLPTVVELRQQIAGAKLLTTFIVRKHRQQVVGIELQLSEITDRVNAFYALLGDRHWVYPDYLSSAELDPILSQPVDDAERSLIDVHKSPEIIRRIDLRLHGHSALRSRLKIIRRAANNYVAERHMECVLLLLTVMDGFVADVDQAHGRGLHTRESGEMVAWDSVVGHHKGLAHAHTIFKKTSRRTSDDPLFDLQRHGIIHGRQLNYDNDVTATKAWNQLLALRDWATSLELASQPLAPKPSWPQMARQLQENAANEKALAAWTPSILTPADDGFVDDPVVTSTTAYLTDWLHRRYGLMAAQLTSMFLVGSDGKRAGQVRSGTCQ